MNEAAFFSLESLFWNHSPCKMSLGKQRNSICENTYGTVSCSRKTASGKKKKKVNSYETAKWILTLCRVTCRVWVACLIADKLWKATKYSFSCPNSRWPQIIPNSRYHNEPLLPKSTLLKIFHWTTFPLCICQFKDLNTLGPDFAAVAFTFLKWPTC